MPSQTVFFDERTAAKRVQVLKVYDTAYAHSCFDEMDEDALAYLQKALDLENQYDLPEQPATLEWEHVEDEAREDGNVLSFFVVLEDVQGELKPLYVAPDSQSALAFAKSAMLK